MTLSTRTQASSPRLVPVGAADLGALACAASAGVHGALVVPHAEESTRMAVAFAAAAAALAMTAVALALLPHPTVSTGAAGVLLAVAAAYVLSRTSGLPGLTRDPEPLDTLGAVTSLVEVAAAVVLTRRTLTRRDS